LKRRRGEEAAKEEGILREEKEKEGVRCVVLCCVVL